MTRKQRTLEHVRMAGMALLHLLLLLLALGEVTSASGSWVVAGG